MYQTLFYIPQSIAGLPVFGIGWLLGVWGAVSVCMLAWLIYHQGMNGDTWSYVPLLIIVGAAIAWLLPALCEPGKGLPIRSYGTMMLVAIAVGTALTVWRARPLGINADTIFSLVFWMFVPGIIGARIFYVIEYWQSYQRANLGDTIAAMLNVAEGGLVVYGSLIGGVLGLLMFVRKNRLPLLAICDLIAPALVLGLALGRIGCLLNGCCFGGLCDLPWAVSFPAGSPPYQDQVMGGKAFVHGLKFDGDMHAGPKITEVEPGSMAEKKGLKAGQEIMLINERRVRTIGEARQDLSFLHEPDNEIVIAVSGVPAVYRWTIGEHQHGSLPVHPTQLYSSINAFILSMLLLAYAPFRRRDGELFAVMMTIYPITRFLLEIIRVDEQSVFGTGLSISQNVSLLLLIGIGLLWAYILRQPPGLVLEGQK